MQELESASRRAKQLWGRDAATVDEEGKRSRRGSLGSAYARTVIGPSASALDITQRSGDIDSHDQRCDVCRKVSLGSYCTPALFSLIDCQMIFGVRYQCAMCPSKPHPYSLVSAMCVRMRLGLN